jgi:hypothetical protein
MITCVQDLDVSVPATCLEPLQRLPQDRLQPIRKVLEDRSEQDVLHVGDQLHLLDQLVETRHLVKFLVNGKQIENFNFLFS